MANEIGWGAAFSEESGYGMAAVNGAEIGYGNVVVNSYSGETNISSMDADNEPADRPTILNEMPLIYLDSIERLPVLFLSFILADGVMAMDMNIEVVVDGQVSFNLSVSSGITELWSFPPNGEYYVNLDILVAGGTHYSFTSNVLTI